MTIEIQDVPPTHDSVVAKTLRAAAPGYGFCYRCGWPWKFTKGHTTDYSIVKGCFPLCEKCWLKLGCPEARIPYYKMLIDRWELDLPVAEEEKRAIQRAVANGG